MAMTVQARGVYPDLAGQTAIVTGGSRGIGLATASELAANGVKVAIVARTLEEVIRAAEQLQAATGVEALGVATDCCDAEGLAMMVAEVSETLGPPQILMAFAGGFHRTTPFLEIEEEEWRKVIDLNLTTTFLTLKAVVPGMVARGKGAIVTMASNAGRLLDIPLTASYAASKAGIVQLTRHAAMELGPLGVRLNVVAPATILTERVSRTLSQETLAALSARAPLRRIGVPEDSASAAVFLVSASASWLTGITLDVAGGRIMM